MSANGDGAALWGGRFADGPSPELEALSRSTHFDWELAPYDLRGSRAHARALAAAGFLTTDELERMLAGIDEIDAGVADGSIRPRDSDEDVHFALERELVAALGPELGGKLRAGRSRNDQIATLVRLYLLDHADTITAQVSQLIGKARMASGGTRLVHSREMKVIERYSVLGAEGKNLAMLLLRLGRGRLGH